MIDPLAKEELKEGEAKEKVMQKITTGLSESLYKRNNDYLGVTAVMYGANDGNPCQEDKDLGSACVVRFINLLKEVMNDFR